LNLKDAIEKAKADSKKRNFVQSVDLVVNFKNLDFAKNENKVNVEIFLPKGRGREIKVCVICEDEMATGARTVADRVILASELEEIGKDPKQVKELANKYDAFIAQMSLMAKVGKFLGQALGPRGKMPKPVPPQADLKPLVHKLKGSVAMRVKGKNMPVLHAPIGTEAMSGDDLLTNANAVLAAFKGKIPDPQHISSVYVKTTMGPAIRAEEVF
jgi:large subunit ribosomal protein L1